MDNKYRYFNRIQRYEYIIIRGKNEKIIEKEEDAEPKIMIIKRIYLVLIKLFHIQLYLFPLSLIKIKKTKKNLQSPINSSMTSNDVKYVIRKYFFPWKLLR